MTCHRSPGNSTRPGCGRPRSPAPAAPHLAAWGRRAVTALCLVTLVLSAAGCGRADGWVAPRLGARRRPRSLGALFTAPPAPAPGPLPWMPDTGTATPTPSPSPSPSPCPAKIAGFSCLMAQRIRQAERYAAGRPGTIGIVLHNRQTGATWRNRYAHTDFPAASTIKLAMVADVMLRADAGQISLDGYDWNLIYNILHESSDIAGDGLWFAFEDGSFLGRIERMGMRTASFTQSQPYWGYMDCSAQDLDNLMNFVLDKMPARNRDYIVDHLRRVATIEQWGVWGAGRALKAGNKDGWEDDGGVWITNTVGFAGPHERYTLAIMDDLGGGTFHGGSNTLTQISSLLFRGHHAPQPRAQATP
jgi:hypothetical protein